MTDHWKGLEFELAELDYQHDRTPSVETIPSLISNLSICRDYKSSN